MEFDVENSNLRRPFKNGNIRELDQFDTENNVIISIKKSQWEGEFRLDSEEMRVSKIIKKKFFNIPF